MIIIKNKNISSIFKNNRPIQRVMNGSKVVWELILSCFGKGGWIDKERWSDTDGWKEIK